MTVTAIEKDTDALTMRIVAELDAPATRAWELWSDPRQLERWWGPPTYPATFVDHDLRPDGRVSYFMTGPEGDEHHGWWQVVAAAPPNHLEFEDGFAHDDGRPNPDLPTTRTRVELTDRPDGGTRMTIETTFPSLAAMEQMIEMGMEEGMSLAMGQMDGILAGQPATR
jgi:uncharacterized protein YndB with AHSA1/START domain